MNRRTVYLIIFLLILAFTLYEELHLRSYLFKTHSYILAGSLPNFLAPLIMSFAFFLFKNITETKQILRSTTAIVCGLILYEFIQLMMPNMVFDIKDIVASILGGLLAFLLALSANAVAKSDQLT